MAASLVGNTTAESGLGTRCPEAQADGVPCPELGLDCEICGGRRAAAPDAHHVCDSAPRAQPPSRSAHA
jgi:hypothetical protein